MAKFMSTHKLPPGGFTRQQACQLGEAASNEAAVKPYRSFLNLSAGQAVCVLEAENSQQVAAWFKKVGMPYDAITQVEFEGEGGQISDA